MPIVEKGGRKNCRPLIPVQPCVVARTAAAICVPTPQDDVAFRPLINTTTNLGDEADCHKTKAWWEMQLYSEVCLSIYPFSGVIIAVSISI